MQRLIITGANGVGKSHLAGQLGNARPEVPVVSFDSMKLETGWKQRPRPEIDAQLSRTIESDAWILEGGPSMLSLALPRANAVIWLDPPELVRAWRLLTRPWRNLGKTRQELPPGNADWPLQQYQFAIQSLKNRTEFQRSISATLAGAKALRVWHCQSQRDIDTAANEWCHANE